MAATTTKIHKIFQADMADMDEDMGVLSAVCQYWNSAIIFHAYKYTSTFKHFIVPGGKC